MEIGTEESINFLENYADSKVNDFVLSNWKHVIDFKWKIIFKRLIIPSLLNWTHGIFFNLAMLFPEFIVLFIFDFIAIAIIFGYESL